mmetsp:Transcript_51672/g.155096  ORF Transcript_51672/g.155096 Transcript_51672/m.155096 type:complete len:399 (+) Transcript_51672:2301-3497(+)
MVEVKDVMIPFVVLFTLNVTFLLTWSVVDPFVWVRVQVDELNSYGRCAAVGEGKVSTACFALTVTFNLVALILANFQAYQARDISDEFSESKYIGMAMLGILQTVFFSFPVVFLVKNEPSARYFVYSSIIFVISMSLLLLIFVKKVKLLHEMNKAGKNRSEKDTSTKNIAALARTCFLKTSNNTGEPNMPATPTPATPRVSMESSKKSKHSEDGAGGSQGIRVIGMRSSPPDVERDESKDMRRSRSTLFHRRWSIGRQSTGHKGIRVRRKSLKVQLDHYKKNVGALRIVLHKMGVDADSAFREAGLDVPLCGVGQGRTPGDEAHGTGHGTALSRSVHFACDDLDESCLGSVEGGEKTGNGQQQASELLAVCKEDTGSEGLQREEVTAEDTIGSSIILF